MARLGKPLLVLLALGAAAFAATACGSMGVSVATTSPYHSGAELFASHCSGCHTLTAAGAMGSADQVKDRQRTNGPNLNYRHETVTTVLYAIRNGGFSGAIMPQNVVVGPEAQAVASFVAQFAGRSAKQAPGPSSQPGSGF
jgi:mono/diheme cytochrome c family protein